MDIHLVRHGETEANESDRFQGHHDTPLNETGKQATLEVACTLASNEYDLIYSSPLKRSLDTSKLLAQKIKTDVRIATELKEICYGEWEGRRKDELRKCDVWEKREEDKYNFVHPGTYREVQGESYADIFPRVSDFFRQLIKSKHELVLLVTHLGVLRNAKKYFENSSDEEASVFTPNTRQVYTVTLEGNSANTNLLTVD